MWTSSADELGNRGAEIIYPCDFLSVISHLPKLPGHPRIAPPLGTACLKHELVGHVRFVQHPLQQLCTRFMAKSHGRQLADEKSSCRAED